MIKIELANVNFFAKIIYLLQSDVQMKNLNIINSSRQLEKSDFQKVIHQNNEFNMIFAFIMHVNLISS